MKIHRLRLQAFGPFPEPCDIDFDALGAGGLHLIHGATGSGKTSILDAICFALFGQVTGARRGLGGPVSTLAAPDVTPEVDLEVTLSGRRLRFIRRPEHERPKKRGGGLTTVRSSVGLSEWDGHRWTVISTRVQEVQHLVDTSLGLHLDQFAQVILLPQGGFAQFLHAEPDARADVLRRLFDIERFADVEQWFTDRRRAAAAELAAARRPVDRARTVVELALAEVPGSSDPPESEPRVESRLAETLDVPPDPQEWPEDQLPDIVTRIAAEVADRATTAAAEADAAETAARETHTALSHAQRTITLHSKGIHARRALDALDAPDAVAAAEEARSELDRAERVARLAPTLRQLRLAEQEQTVTESAESTTRAAVDPTLENADTSASWSMSVHDGAEPMRSAAHRLDAVVSATRRAEQAVARRREIIADQERLTTELHALEVGRDRLETDAADLAESAGQVEDVDQLARLVEGAIRRRRQVRQASERERLVADAVRETDESVAVAARHAEEQRRAHVAQLTGRLAADLSDGEPCAVCGSTDHPAPAPVPSTVVTQDEVDTAEDAHRITKQAFDAAMSDLVAARTAHTHAVAEAELELAATRSAASEVLAAPVPELPDESTTLDAWIQDVRARVATRLREARQARQRLSDINQQRAGTLEQISSLEAQLVERRLDLAAVQVEARSAATSALEDAHRAQTDLARHDAACRCLQDAENDPTSPIAPLPSGEPDELVKRLVDDTAREMDRVHTARTAVHRRLQRHERVQTAVDRWHEAESRRQEATRRAAELATTFAELLAQEGFAGSADVEAHQRSAEQRALLVSQIQERSRARTEVETVLADPEVLATLDVPVPDATALRAAAEAADTAARRARAQASALERVRTTLLAAARDLTAALKSLRPLQERHDALDRLAAVINAERGAGGDRRMRLSAYVLAARLEEVVRLANERLGTMTDHRFTLEHDDGPGSRGTRGGLGLRIHDAWTGTQRSTRSLSGGETFLASLALALALGDAIQQDTGGRQLQTLFVDEGFGSLDEDSLELVLDVLDELRSGGRTVGIVSHVPELRQRIPAQIEVLKSETGSTVRTHLPGRSTSAA